MILEGITIENIRSYSHEEVVFPKGISLFEGDIGSGKSTVLMAIEFALFGLGSQKAASLLAKKSESGFVILDFSVDGKKYEIKRTLRKGRTGVSQDPKNSWIRIEGEMLPLSPSELKQQILEILRFNEPADPRAESRIFRYAIFTPQEAMKEVLSDPGRRLETIRKAFGIEDYGTARTNSMEVLLELRSRGRILQERSGNISELESDIVESHKRIKELDTDIAGLFNAVKTKKAKEEETAATIRELREENNETIRLKSERDGLVERMDSARKQLSQVKDDLAELESESIQNSQRMKKLAEIKRPETELSMADIASEIKRFQKASDDLIGLNSSKESILQEISRLRGNLGDRIDADRKSIESELDILQKEKESLEESLEEITEKKDKIRSQQVEKNTLRSSLEREITEFEKLGSICPTCKQEISKEHHHALVDKRQNQVDRLNQELKEIADSFFDSDSNAKEIEGKLGLHQTKVDQIQQSLLPGIDELASKKSSLSEIEAKIREIENKDDEEEGARDKEYRENPIEFLTNLKDRMVDFKNAAEQTSQIRESEKRIEERVSQKRTRLGTLKDEIDQKETELANMKKMLELREDVEGRISELESRQDELREEINEMSGQLAASKERRNSEQEKATTIEKNISESKRWQKKLKILSELEEWLEEFFIPTISQIEKQVFLSILHNFNETYIRWYSILVEDPTKESRIDENFTPVVNQDGFDQEVNYLSGGEKTSIALAYRLTLNSLMRRETEAMKSNLLILDEPTDGFSKNQLGKIRELFDELKSEQIVLVSHEKELETYVDNIFQISKQDGISKISRLN